MPLFVITMLPTHCTSAGPSPQPNGHHFSNRISSLPPRSIAELRYALKKHGGESVLPILAGDVTIHASRTIVQMQHKLDAKLITDIDEHMPHGPTDSIVLKFRNLKVYQKAVKSKEYQDALKTCQKEYDEAQQQLVNADVPAVVTAVVAQDQKKEDAAKAEGDQPSEVSGGESSAENGDDKPKDAKPAAATATESDAVAPAAATENNDDGKIKATEPNTKAETSVSTTKAKFEPHVFAFEQNSMYIDWVVPTLKNIYRWLGYHVDCETPATPEQRRTDMHYDLKQSNGDTGMENYKGRVANAPNQPCYMLQLLTKDTATDRGKKANALYTKAFVQALFSYNITMKYCGNTISVNGGPKEFQQIYLLEFPSRELYIEWMESEYFHSVMNQRDASILDSFVQLGLPVY